MNRRTAKIEYTEAEAAVAILSERSALKAVPFRRMVMFAVMAAAIVVASLVDLPRTRQSGSMTWLGAITVAQSVVGVVALLFVEHAPTRVVKLVALFGAFVLWAALSIIWAPPRNEGLQNAAVYLAFTVLLTLSAAATAGFRPQVERVIGTSMVMVDVIALSLVVASMVFRGWPTDPQAWFVHARALALFGLVPLSWHLARWMHGNARSALSAGLWVVALFVSLSRAATGIALVLVVLALRVRARSGRAVLPSRLLLLSLVPLAFAAALTVKPFRERLFFPIGRDASTSTFQLRDNGRMIMWRIVARSALEAPIVGKGLGSSESVVSAEYEWTGHPHNEYLRVWHDLGMVGLSLLLAAFVLSWRALWTDWCRRRRRAEELEPTLQLAALGALLALLLGMLTDNSLVYNFVMAPTAVLVGAGLGAGLGASSPRHHRRKMRRDATRSTPSNPSDGVGDHEADTLTLPLRVRKDPPRR